MKITHQQYAEFKRSYFEDDRYTPSRFGQAFIHYLYAKFGYRLTDAKLFYEVDCLKAESQIYSTYIQN